MRNKSKIKIKTRTEIKPFVYINLFKPPYVEIKTVTYEKPYLEIKISKNII